MTTAIKPSDQQLRILEEIVRSTEERGFPPTIREIGKACGLRSSSTVANHLQKLKRFGLIETDPTKSRAIRVVRPEGVHREDSPEQTDP